MPYILKCDKCEEKFKWAFHGEEKRWPDYCPNCGEFIGSGRDDDDIVMPFIRHAATNSHDKVYRDIEAGSEVRAEIAAERLGVPMSEMSDVKITNLNDRRDAEMAAIAPVAETQRLTVGNSMPSFQGNGAEMAQGIASGAVHFNGQVTRGIAPRAGANAMKGFQTLLGK